MLSVADVFLLIIITFCFIGATLLSFLLLYARREYGPRKSRTIGAILIDTSFGFAATIVLLCVISTFRPLGYVLSGVPAQIVRYTLITAYFLSIWWPVFRLLVWLWKGDYGQTELRERPGERIFDNPGHN